MLRQIFCLLSLSFVVLKFSYAFDDPIAQFKNQTKTPDLGTFVTGQVLDDEGNPIEDFAIWVKVAGHQPAENPPVESMDQVNKEFVPHILMATVGTSIQFFNRDPIFHHVFSKNKAQPLDLGKFKGVEPRVEVFKEQGIYPLNCDIHPWMQAYIIILDTPFYAKTTSRGLYRINEMLPGTYPFFLWSSRLKSGIKVEKTLKEGANQVNFQIPQAKLKRRKVIKRTESRGLQNGSQFNKQKVDFDEYDAFSQ